MIMHSWLQQESCLFHLNLVRIFQYGELDPEAAQVFHVDFSNHQFLLPGNTGGDATKPKADVYMTRYA